MATHVEEFIFLDQNIEHAVATGGARLHLMEMDSRWNILYLIGILHSVPRELQEIRARPYMEIAFGEQMQIIHMDPHTQQNSHSRQLTIEELAALGEFCYVQWTFRIRPSLELVAPLPKEV